jgi:hypothetical protein
MFITGYAKKYNKAIFEDCPYWALFIWNFGEDAHELNWQF